MVQDVPRVRPRYSMERRAVVDEFKKFFSRKCPKAGYLRGAVKPRVQHHVNYSARPEVDEKNFGRTQTPSYTKRLKHFKEGGLELSHKQVSSTTEGAKHVPKVIHFRG